MSAPTAQIDLEAMKAKQKAAWRSGNYALIGSTLQIVGEELAEAYCPSAGERILDVAAGNGNATLAFARRFCDVTSTDYVADLLARGRARAEAEGSGVTYQVEDAENLSFADGAFDGVVSTFGVMFTADQAAAAGELQRVCRAGGKIGLANWTPESFVGKLFGVISTHVPPPPGAPKPPVWGTEDWIQSHFGMQTRDISIKRKTFTFYQRSPQAFVDFFRTYYGPTERAFSSLDEASQALLERDFLDLIDTCNEAGDGTMRVPSEYLEIVMTKA